MGCKDRKRLDFLVSRAIWGLNGTHGEFSETPAYLSSSEARGRKNFFFLHRQSLRRMEEPSLHDLDSCRALGQNEAVQNLLVAPVDVTRLHSLKICRLLLPRISCFHRWMAICSLENLSLCCGLNRSCVQ